MAKTITLTYEGTKYTLEFTRKTVEQMERSGFNVRDIRTQPVTTLPVLFAGSFLAHHRWVKDDVISSIFEKLPKKDEFLEKLAEMYNEPLEAMLAEPEEEGNVSWGADF